MAQAIAIRTAAHAFEGKVFSVVSCSTVTEEMIEVAAGDDPQIAEQMRRPHSALSGIFGPDGNPVVEPLIDVEGIVYGEIDLARCIQPKQMHDIVGHYNRFDVFSLHHNTTPLQPVVFEQEVRTSSSRDGGAVPLIGPWQQPDEVEPGPELRRA
jgi:aliphatic nitrilase